MDYILIYQEIPEAIKIYHFYYPDPETQRLLELSHGYYINGDEYNEEIANFINRIADTKPLFTDGKEILKFKSLTNCKFIVCGFIL